MPLAERTPDHLEKAKPPRRVGRRDEVRERDLWW
jgi:hypothetical protein